jgi:glycine dehydrogenase
MTESDPLRPTDLFQWRHIGPNPDEVALMLAALGYPTLDALVDATVPAGIRLRRALALPEPTGEHATMGELRAVAQRNRVMRSFIGMGYYETIVPPVIQRNVLENPGWYTQYTPYQAEIAQGRLEALVNFQTMVSELTGLPVANASLLDEGTAAAEAMYMCHAADRRGRTKFYVAGDAHPQTIAVVKTRGEALGLTIEIGPIADAEGRSDLFGLLVPYPTSGGRILDYRPLATKAHGNDVMVVSTCDLLALTLIRPPGEWGADIAVGSTQRFGVPMGFGGPHAAFLATREQYVRQLPGRVVGVSKDKEGRVAYRLALQTREQHIRRDRATSNICTAQVLPAILASFYAVHHGAEGLRAIALRIRTMAVVLAAAVQKLGLSIGDAPYFLDTMRIRFASREATESVLKAARARGINMRDYGDSSLAISLDEATTTDELQTLIALLADGKPAPDFAALVREANPDFGPFNRQTPFLTQEVFHRNRSEHEMLRYIRRLQAKDLSLTTSMIPLGSCTMKLNSTSEMMPISWPELARMHPFAPADQTEGYAQIFRDLQAWLGEITGFSAVSLQPNAGSQGEYTGLLVIDAYHRSRGHDQRKVCLIPTSAHGTNPASAAIAGFKVVTVACDANGNIEVADLKAKAAEHRERLAALMVTYPSTYGVFEESIREVCQIVHEHGGQVYMDGANMNAQVGLTRPADMGADVCHLNLHKTFCIPHGGGGPGMGPIGVAAHLMPFLPGHGVTGLGGPQSIGPIAAAPYGSASILAIPWMYIRLMGASGLKTATEVAILSANYMAQRLAGQYEIVFRGKNGRVAHEFIVDMRPFKAAGIEAEDVAKRLMDYGFHAPTLSFPVAGTLMIEPTESESKAELDRFCDAMISIREEIRAVADGRMDRADNPLKNAPHTVHAVTASDWKHPYTREQAAFPAPWLRQHKFWPAVSRIDSAYGDRNFVCTCPPIEAYE